jgi:hypothetical protein
VPLLYRKAGWHTPPPSSDVFHSYKKTKDLAGALSIIPTPTPLLFQSPQHKLFAKNKQMRVQSPSCFSTLLSVGSSLSSDQFSGSSNGKGVSKKEEDNGNDNRSKGNTSLASKQRKATGMQGIQTVPCGEHRYGSSRGEGSRSRSHVGASAFSKCYDLDDSSSSSLYSGSGSARGIWGISCGEQRGVSPIGGGSCSGNAAWASKLMLSKRYNLDDTSSSSLNSGSGRWSNEDSMAEEGASFVKPDEDGVASLALFCEVMEIDPFYKEELVILKGFWPGLHDVNLLSWFVTLHFVWVLSRTVPAQLGW